MEEKKTPIYPDGIMFKVPNENTKEKAPWVKGHISIKVKELTQFIQKYNNDGWVNLDLKKSKEKGTLYLELNQWKKKENSSMDNVEYPSDDISPEDIPF